MLLAQSYQVAGLRHRLLRSSGRHVVNLNFISKEIIEIQRGDFSVAIQMMKGSIRVPPVLKNTHHFTPVLAYPKAQRSRMFWVEGPMDCCVLTILYCLGARHSKYFSGPTPQQPCEGGTVDFLTVEGETEVQKILSVWLRSTSNDE